ncbi:MAG: hypothetical protein IJH36_03220 [Clostridia bacterium]|nr:hypothetical protein [Clostridia bacterium]MBQ3462112.1 hypothetical protein [Clostridia bacterium]MBQ3472244.1 hypothetical protein [Clostridia bacterium]MBR0470973.1 hypothetical protein [Clostridia bacterium]
MNRAEFIERCQMGGYCTKHTASEYAEGKEEFEEIDIENAYRMEQERISKREANRERFTNYQGTKSTKRYHHHWHDNDGVTMREGS